MREYHLMEKSFGTNDKFNDGKVTYLSSHRAYILVSKVNDDLYIVLMIYLDGRVVISSLNTPDVLTIVKSSIKQLFNPVNINKAYSYDSYVTEMLRSIISKFYNKIDTLNFVVSDRTSLNKLERYLRLPDVKQYLESKRFEYIDHTKDSKLISVLYKKK